MRYAEIKGITLYSKKDLVDFYYYYTVPNEEYDRIDLECRKEGNYNRLNDLCLFPSSISRTDPALVQVVEELGDDANGTYAKLLIEELPAGTLYRIDEYDGNETVMTQDDYDWSVA